jgi:GTP:adenosylcobinamide-phosphate guanylyltransferase/thiamine kinase-like enzyme
LDCSPKRRERINIPFWSASKIKGNFESSSRYSIGKAFPFALQRSNFSKHANNTASVNTLNIDYIIVQAGGKGSRLEHLTANKPKALVPVENLPMLFHLFRRFPEKRFVIIADYQQEVMREYLECFADIQYLVVEASGGGTCGGIGQALAQVPDNAPFMLIWSDLVLSDAFQLPEAQGNFVGISQTFPCRWKFQDGVFTEERSVELGVAGLFIFENKAGLAQLPKSGEFVRWLKESRISFNRLGLTGIREFGIFSEYDSLAKEKCRPFNRMIIDGDIVTKEAIDEQGKKLAKREIAWYGHAMSLHVPNIPKIFDTLGRIRMERIIGKNIYEYDGLMYHEKREVLQKLVGALSHLHSLERTPADAFSIKDAYYGKTMDRLRKIRDLVPLADRKAITINGRKCRNVFFHKRDLEKKLDSLLCPHFAFIHGDCTFSNMMLRNDRDPVFIDPRGYFGHTALYGDPNYDWAKLYYSVVGNYDRFNLKDFRLNISDDEIELKIASNRWEALEQDFFALSGTDPQAIKLLHAVIWLSLTTYAWQDYDSICGAFYNGLYYLEEAL